MHDQDRVGELAAEELRRAEDRAVLVGIVDVLGDDEHHRIDRCGTRRAARRRRSPLASRSSSVTPSVSLVSGVRPIVLPADDHRRLDELVGDRGGERIAEDDLVLRRLLVRRRRQADQHPRVEVADRLRERRAVVGVVLVGEDDEVLDRLEVGVELGSEALLELVRLAAGLRFGLDQRLDGEEVDLDLRSSSIAARMAGVAKFSDVITTGWKLIGPSRLFGMARREVVPGLLQDRPARRDDHEVAHAVAAANSSIAPARM